MTKEIDRSEISAFIHGRKPDGLFRSVCTTCFQSVSEKAIEKDLAADEAAHVCADTPLSRRYKDKLSN